MDLKEIYYICAQPATFFYAWQVDAMLLSFKKFGEVDLNKVHIVSSVSIANPNPDEHFKKVELKWKDEGVLFEYFKDNRPFRDYISSIRPHILKKHWLKYPWLKNKHIFYHDCDIVLTKPINFNFSTRVVNKTCLVSDTIDYIGANYIDAKKHNLLEIMCNIVEIDVDLVRSKEKNSGGAQYLIKPGVDYLFWEEVYINSENLFKNVTKIVNKIKKDNPEWHELQIWCADMWCVLWALWKRGYETKVTPDLDFTWGTHEVSLWKTNAIYHNAGVVSEDPGQPFYKSKYYRLEDNLLDAPIPNEKWASRKYYELVMEAYQNTISR